MKTDVIINNIVRFIGLLLLQLIIIDNIQINIFINPFIYVLFIILLPVNISVSLAMILALLIGLGNDVFSNTGGIHAAAAVFLAFVRPFIINLLAPPVGYEDVVTPSIKNLGISWFITYSATLVFMHHTVLFFLEIFSFSEIWYTLLKILGSTVASIVLIIISEFLFYPKKTRHK